MRNLVSSILKLAAALSVGLLMAISAPSVARADNATDATKAYLECLAQLVKTGKGCGGPFTMDTGTSSISANGPASFESRPYCGYCEHRVYFGHTYNNWYCAPDKKHYKGSFKKRAASN